MRLLRMKPGAFDDVAAAKQAEERRGDRHHVAVLVDDREIRRVPVLGGLTHHAEIGRRLR